LLTQSSTYSNINIKSAHNYLDNNVYQVGNSWNKPNYPISKDIISFNDSSIKGDRNPDGTLDTKGFLELKKDSKSLMIKKSHKSIKI